MSAFANALTSERLTASFQRVERMTELMYLEGESECFAIQVTPDRLWERVQRTLLGGI